MRNDRVLIPVLHVAHAAKCFFRLVYTRIFIDNYNAFNVYRRELAPGTVNLTGDIAQGDDSKHWANSIGQHYSITKIITFGLYEYKVEGLGCGFNRNRSLAETDS